MTTPAAPARFCPECGQTRAEEVCPQHGIPTIVQQIDDFTRQLIGTVIAGRYKVESLIGQGGFGAVFRAVNQMMRQEMVVKVLRPEYAKDPIQVQRFFNEGRTAAQLTHQHTVRVYDFGQTDAGQLYLAMELLHGQELAKVLRDEKAIDPMRAIRIAIAVLKSLAEAHDAGMVHRDLKPENVFLCKMRGEDDFVKLIDFGIAKSFEQADQDLTKTGFAVGTPKYMSPEQGRAEPLDGRSDLYSLGIILYQCLTGDVPFKAPSAMGVIVKHLQERPVPLEQAATQPLPAGLAEVVMKSLAKRREERFEDADEMRLALEHVLETAGESLTGRGRPHTSRALPNVAPISGASTPQPMQTWTPPSTGAPPSLASPDALIAPTLVETRPRYSSGIGEFLSTMGNAPAAASQNPIGWVPPAEPTDHDSAVVPAAAPSTKTPAQTASPTPGAVRAGAAPGTPSLLTPGTTAPPVVAAPPRRPPPAPPSKSAGAWVFMLLVTGILGAAGWWYWNKAQEDPEAMDRLRGVTALVDKGKAKLDELTGATDQPSTKSDDPPAADDGATKKKSGKAAKAKADDAPATEVTHDAAIAATQGAVQKCYAKDGGKARDFTRVIVDVTLDDTGLVKRASLRKKFGTGSTAKCVEAAVLQAHLPSGQSGERTMEYDLPVPEEK